MKERRELLEANPRKVSLELQEMQRTLALIDAKIVHYRSLESEQSATSKEHVSSLGKVQKRTKELDSVKGKSC